MRSSASLSMAPSATLAFVGSTIAGGKGDKEETQEDMARAACLLGRAPLPNGTERAGVALVPGIKPGHPSLSLHGAF